ncbi:lipocalin family protein [uncultured Sphaerochaeta sp.]|uniref:lipocalin family protein n=1 Tax=uncultured Sphaerochaeta sp. TaxID=886478 RepID=UPI002AA8D7A7|nr:lipocalin family protein [uncultured Sphaerochaeta sp.]
MNGNKKGRAMKRKGLLSIGGILAMLVMLTSCATTGKYPPLDTVSSLDLDRYLGSWYEIARYQHRFEKNLVGAKADYSLRDDGRIQVVNSGIKGELEGKITSVKAVAWRPDEGVPGRLKVRFFGLFTSDYLVFGLDEDYQWALVGSDDRDFLWFLSRTPEVSDATLDAMKAIAVEQGYDMEKLFLVPQKER